MERRFPYTQTLTTFSYLDHAKFQVEITNRGKVNLLLSNGRNVETGGQATIWKTLQAEELDDLITVLQYARLELNKNTEGN